MVRRNLPLPTSVVTKTVGTVPFLIIRDLLERKPALR